MTMQLQGLRDSLNVKLNAALKVLNHADYRAEDLSIHPTLVKCDYVLDEFDKPMVTVQVEKMYNNTIQVYDFTVQLRNNVYTVLERAHMKDMDDGIPGASGPITSGREVVEYIVAKVCYFMGLAYR